MKAPQGRIQTATTVFLSLLSSAACNKEQSERDELEKIARGEYKYTLNYKDNDLSTDDKQREYCKMSEENFEMFFLLRKKAEECRRCEDDNTRIVELKYLCGSESPRKWMEYVIFYSLEKRLLDINDDKMFIGIALYSQYYNVTGKHRDLLIDNLFELYIKKRILDPPPSKSSFLRNAFISIKRMLLDVEDSFHNRIYRDSNINLRDAQELTLLEELMKAVLLAVLKKYELPFSYEDRTGNLMIYEKDLYYLEDWCCKRESMGNGEVTSFSSVVMRRMRRASSDCMGDEHKKILLTLIGMVRTGNNIVSVRCLCWFGDEDDEFSKTLKLVNTNRNLVGIAELNSAMDFDKLLGGIKSQLRYLEVNFDNNSVFAYVAALKFINSLNNEIAIDVSLSDHIVVSVIEVLLSNPKIKYILNLRIENAWDDYEFETHKSVLASKKIIGIEMYNCDMSLEELLLDDDFRAFRDKLRVLEVSSVGNLHNKKITNADLTSLELDRLQIKAYYRKEAMMDFVQLVDRGVIDGKYFKYLVFKSIHHRYRQRIVDLRNRLGEREWPVVLTSFKPPDAENVDYSEVCWGCFYELHYSGSVRVASS